jgi:hypothetical protein
MKITNNRSIPSTHAERQITDLSVKHSFTLYPSLSPYGQTESLTEEHINYGIMNHRCHHWNKRMLTIVQNTFYSRRAQWLPLVNERFVIKNMVAVSILFFGLGVTKNAAKPNCVLPIGDDGSSYDDSSSGELIVINIDETQLSWKQQSCQ